MKLRLRELRKQSGLTQTELANMIDVNLRSISSWERGATVLNAENIVRLCTALKCTPNDLLGWTDADNHPPIPNDPAEDVVINNYRESDAEGKEFIRLTSKFTASHIKTG